MSVCTSLRSRTVRSLDARYNRNDVTVEIVFTGNGPGELAGWVRPVAHAVKEVASERGMGLSMTMALTPSQFASGHEAEVIGEWALFDRILEPAESVRLAVGMGRLFAAGTGTLVHLGGDLWFSSRLAARAQLPACALAETQHVARRHGSFAQVFATSQDVAGRLIHAGVPGAKISVTGDPRADTVPTQLPPLSRDGSEHVVSFLPGSRDYLFRALVPYFLNIADQLHRHERMRFQMVVSPFLRGEVIDAVRRDARQTYPDLALEWIVTEPWPALGESDLVVTVPGTNTVELGVAGVPFVAIAPAALIDHLRLEGLANWITRIPVIGRPFKRAVALRALHRQRFIALPNQHAGRLIAPEWIGTWPQDAFISYLQQLLADQPRRARMSAALRGLYAGARGASRRIAERSLALAGGVDR